MAVNGARTHNVEQYQYARIDRKRPDMDLIFWNGVQYREITANPPKHLFGVDLVNRASLDNSGHPAFREESENNGNGQSEKRPPVDPTINSPDADGNTKLLRAFLEGHPNLVPDIIASGGDIKATNHQGQTVLHVAFSHGFDPEILEKILAARPDVNAQDRDGLTPLHVVAMADGMDKIDPVRMLLAAGANPNLRDKQGRTPVHLFLTGKWPWSYAGDSIAALAKAGADLSARDNQGRTPLHYLAALGSPGPLLEVHSQTFDAAKVDFQARDDQGDTPLDVAAKNGTFDVLDWLTKHGSSLDATNSLGTTPRQLAAHNQYAPDSNLPEVSLYEAIRENRTDCLVSLTKACPDLINEPKRFGMTPLAFAIRWHRTNAVAILQEAGGHE